MASTSPHSKPLDGDQDPEKVQDAQTNDKHIRNSSHPTRNEPNSRTTHSRMEFWQFCISLFTVLIPLSVATCLDVFARDFLDNNYNWYQWVNTVYMLSRWAIFGPVFNWLVFKLVPNTPKSRGFHSMAIETVACWVFYIVLWFFPD